MRLFLLAFLFIFTEAFALVKLSDEDLKKKKEGWFFNAIPLISYSTDDGFGYGARVYIYNNGKRSDKLFSYTPYMSRIYLQYYRTTKGVEYHELNFDAPYVFGSKFRIKSYIAIDKTLNENFFGIGEGCYETLLGGYQKISDVQSYLDELYNSEGKTMSKYYKYSIYKPTFSLKLYYEIINNVSVFFRYKIYKADIEFWDDKEIEIGDNKYIERKTLIKKLSPYGVDGGYVSYISLGVSYDTRDFEPNPKKGIFVKTGYKIYDNIVGSEYDFYKFFFDFRLYYSVVKNIVVAYHFDLEDVIGDAPFFEYSSLSLVGYLRNRFLDRVSLLNSFEIRWMMFGFSAGSETFDFVLVPFYDVGRVFSSLSTKEFDSTKWRSSYGASLMVVWDLATVIRFTYGLSEEGETITIDFGYIF